MLGKGSGSRRTAFSASGPQGRGEERKADKDGNVRREAIRKNGCLIVPFFCWKITRKVSLETIVSVVWAVGGGGLSGLLIGCPKREEEPAVWGSVPRCGRERFRADVRAGVFRAVSGGGSGMSLGR